MLTLARLRTYLKETEMARVLRKATKPFRRLSDVINKLPLAGKLATKPILFWAYKATTWEEKLVRISLALLFLVFFIVFHYFQLEIGWEVYTKSSMIALQAIGIIYVVVNAAVIYTQGILSLRLLRVVVRSSQRNPCRLQYKPYSLGYAMLSLVATFGGQAVFATAKTFV